MWKVAAAAFVLAFASAGIAALVVGGSSSPSVGARVFATRCTGCHTLGQPGNTVGGGDLSNLNLTLGQAASFVRVMPVHPALTTREIWAVSSYVLGD
jgi:mono/diheme cytochrome c family protein